MHTLLGTSIATASDFALALNFGLFFERVLTTRHIHSKATQTATVIDRRGSWYARCPRLNGSYGDHCGPVPALWAYSAGGMHACVQGRHFRLRSAEPQVADG